MSLDPHRASVDHDYIFSERFDHFILAQRVVHNAYIKQLKFLAVVCAWTLPQKRQKIHNGTYLFPGAHNSEENRENLIFVCLKL